MCSANWPKYDWVHATWLWSRFVTSDNDCQNICVQLWSTYAQGLQDAAMITNNKCIQGTLQTLSKALKPLLCRLIHDIKYIPQSVQRPKLLL